MAPSQSHRISEIPQTLILSSGGISGGSPAGMLKQVLWSEKRSSNAITTHVLWLSCKMTILLLLSISY